MAALLSGCGGDGGPQRVVVSGTVTYGGKPVSEGTIRFAPLPTCPAPMTGAMIVDGKYTVNMHGGVPVGTHKVKIEALRKTKNTSMPNVAAPRQMQEAGLEQYIPKKYNANTQLEITIQPGSREISKNFDLTN
jgi:hypothetical protein